jgi:hypothetical protein
MGGAALGAVAALSRTQPGTAEPAVPIASIAPTPPPGPGAAEGDGSTGNPSDSATVSTAGSQPPTPSAAQKSVQLPTRIEDVPDRPARTGSWPALRYTLQASQSAQEPLRFPGAISGFTLVDSAVSTVTITKSRYFTAVGGLPVRTASYDECRRHRFFVRWMALDPDAVVESTFVDEPVRTVQNRPVRGSSGWQSSYGCVQPALRIRPPAGVAPDRATVLVETQVWRRS